MASLHMHNYLINVNKICCSVHPSIVQPPPPYYPPGMENKALENSMDLALDDNTKNTVYGQNGYGYHTQPHPNAGGECKLMQSQVK